MFTGKGFEIILSSDEPYEQLCAEIYFNGEFIAILTQEEGLENAKLHYSTTQPLTFEYSEFLSTIKKAKDFLR